LDPFEIRRRNMIGPADWIESVWGDPSDVDFGSYGLDQCMDLVEEALVSGRGAAKPEGSEWAEGTGIAFAMLESGPPTEHRSSAQMRLLPDGSYHLAVGSTEMGNGSITSHRQIAAEVLGSRAQRIAIVNADTDLAPYDTGTFASTGTVVAGQAVALTAAALRDNILDYASRHTCMPMTDCRLEDTAVVCGGRSIGLAELHLAGSKEGHRFEARRKAYLAPRTVAFNVHGVRLAVHRITAEVRILHSVHAADIGRLINPMQCRGQIDGAIAMGIGWALREHGAWGGWDDGQPDFAELPDSCLRRCPTQRGLFCRHLRPDRAIGRQVSRRVRDQSGGPRNRQCNRPRDRRAVPPSAADTRPHVQRAGRRGLNAVTCRALPRPW
jgi:CO/xanthine dehydrogenase Mo-binding subunit